ncbi:MAG TPA: hypothetical protein VGM03_00950 [Phycisphaerae bacterium]|jgi:hypothetical protein
MRPRYTAGYVSSKRERATLRLCAASLILCLPGLHAKLHRIDAPAPVAQRVIGASSAASPAHAHDFDCPICIAGLGERLHVEMVVRPDSDHRPVGTTISAQTRHSPSHWAPCAAARAPPSA